MKILVAVLMVLLFPAAASASPIAANVWLALESHIDGGIADPLYGLRLDGLEGDPSEEYTFDFSDSRSDMRLYYDDVAHSVLIQGESWGGEDVGETYRDGGSLYSIEMLYEYVVDMGSFLDVAPGGGNVGSITNIDTDVVSALVDVAGSNSFSFRIADQHRGAGPSGWGWVNHSDGEHIYSSDWIFVVGSPIPEPSGAVLFGAGALVVGGFLQRRR